MPARAPEERRQIARIAAHEQHAQGRTNTAPARDAFLEGFKEAVDPDGVLEPDERARRAKHALKAHMARLALKSAQARRMAS